MGLFNLKKEEPIQVQEIGGYQAFSTPFLKVPNGNLSLPFVSDRYQSRGYIPFGSDNLYPQYLNQMYYSSPLHGAIVDFKVNATVGGGYQFDESKLNAKMKVDLYAFGKKISVKKTVKNIVKDLIVHERVYFCLTLKNGILTKLKRVSPEKVRCNRDKSIYSINDDWQYGANIKTLTPYHPECKDGEYLFIYENDSLGQDFYPLPQYTSALNFIYLSGEMSYFAKSNIQNSIFPSFAMMFPKKPQGKEEMELLKDTVSKLKGAENAGKSAAFFANSKEQLPEIVSIPTNDNANLFKESSDLNTEQICFAHTIDPILLGVRTTGALGNGSDIKQAYVIFEKNVIMPLRETTMDIFNQLLQVAKIDAKIEVLNYQIINDTITEVDEDSAKIINAISSMPDSVAAKVLDNMTKDEIRALAGLKPIEPTNETPAL